MYYCQDGLQIYLATETPQYNYDTIYGYYELQPNDVNGRPYFKMGSNGLWWNDIDQWWIGPNSEKGQSFGSEYFDKDVFCPHQLSKYWFGDLGITCEYIHFH